MKIWPIIWNVCQSGIIFFPSTKYTLQKSCQRLLQFCQSSHTDCKHKMFVLNPRYQLRYILWTCCMCRSHSDTRRWEWERRTWSRSPTCSLQQKMHFSFCHSIEMMYPPLIIVVVSQIPFVLETFMTSFLQKVKQHGIYECDCTSVSVSKREREREEDKIKWKRGRE